MTISNTGGLMLAATAALLAIAGSQAQAASDRFIIVQSTTSTQDSGLFNHILPLFQAKTGIEVRVVAVGTGQAIKNAQNGDGDVLLVHARPAEEKFVAEGFGAKRFDVMYNDFVLVGPGADPAKIGGTKDIAAALKTIATGRFPFVSRGDDSGTHKAELALWKAAGVNVKAVSGTWYRESGSGMGPTLNATVGMGAYALSDRATWSCFRNKAKHRIAVDGDTRLINQYGVILVSPAKHPKVRARDGQAFVDWLIGHEGQAAIAGFRINGEQQFFPNASGK